MVAEGLSLVPGEDAGEGTEEGEEEDEDEDGGTLEEAIAEEDAAEDDRGELLLISPEVEDGKALEVVVDGGAGLVVVTTRIELVVPAEEELVVPEPESTDGLEADVLSVVFCLFRRTSRFTGPLRRIGASPSTPLSSDHCCSSGDASCSLDCTSRLIKLSRSTALSDAVSSTFRASGCGSARTAVKRESCTSSNNSERRETMPCWC